MKIQGVIKYLIMLLGVIASSQLYAAPACNGEAYIFEGEVVSKFRVDDQLREQSEIEALPTKWSINQPYYSHVLLRTKDSKHAIKKPQVYVQIGKKIAGPFSLGANQEIKGGDTRARIKDLLFRKIIENARELNSGKVEFSVRSGDDVICTLQMLVRGGD